MRAAQRQPPRGGTGRGPSAAVHARKRHLPIQSPPAGRPLGALAASSLGDPGRARAHRVRSARAHDMTLATRCSVCGGGRRTVAPHATPRLALAHAHYRTYPAVRRARRACPLDPVRRPRRARGAGCMWLCLGAYVSPIRGTGTAIREFKKRHSGSIERISEY